MKSPLLAIAVIFGLAIPLHASDETPNVIFLMADDLGYGDVGFNGSMFSNANRSESVLADRPIETIAQTPHLDRMATDGVRFTRFYSVGPVCSPTRACVQTGRHCMRFGMINVNYGKLPEGEINLARIAKSKGYTTGHFGKWHLGTLSKDPELSGPVPSTAAERFGPPWERHYDATFTTETNVATWDPLDETGLRIPKHRCHFWSNGVEVHEDWRGSTEKIIVDQAISFVEQAVANDQSFMTTIWFYGPHTPTRAGEELRALYPDEPLGRQHYLGSITAIDNQVGRLRQTLEELGVADNTLIFFCSDNGPEGTGVPAPEYNPYLGAQYGSAGEFKGRKRYLYNGGVCVPAFAFWPGEIEPGQTVDEPTCTLDYLPTFAALLNYEMPDERPIDGVSILPVLHGEEWTRGQFIPFASNMQRNSPSASIISRGHKLLFWLGQDKENELYDIEGDPREEENLILVEPELAATLEREFFDWMDSARHSYEKGDYPGYIKQGHFINTGQ